MFSRGPIPYNFAYAFHIAVMPSACSVHIICLDFVTIWTFGEGHRLWSSHCRVFYSLLLINLLDILFSMLFSNTVSVLPLMWERPIPTEGRTTFLCICNHYFLYRIQEKHKLVLHWIYYSCAVLLRKETILNDKFWFTM